VRRGVVMLRLRAIDAIWARSSRARLFSGMRTLISVGDKSYGCSSGAVHFSSTSRRRPQLSVEA
jgi:hypothetical protein